MQWCAVTHYAVTDVNLGATPDDVWQRQQHLVWNWRQLANQGSGIYWLYSTIWGRKNNHTTKNSTTQENDCILLCISNIETVFNHLQIIMQQEVAHRNTDRKLHKLRKMWLSGRVQNSWLNCRGFHLWLEQRNIAFLWGQFSVPTLISVFPPPPPTHTHTAHHPSPF